MGLLYEMFDDSPLINFQHLDMIKGLQSENELPLAQELLKHAQSDGQATLNKLLCALEINDRALATRYAHKLKGMASNLGLRRAHLIFRELERRAKTSEEPILSVPEVESVRIMYTESLEAYRDYANKYVDAEDPGEF